MSEQTSNEIGAMENLGRIGARGFVIAGGIFWIAAAFSGPYVYQDMSLADSLMTAAWPFLTAVVILATGWVYERLAAVLLFAASAAVIVWGSLYAWELGVWILMSFVLLAPMAIAGTLFLMAAHAERKRTVPPAPRTAVKAPARKPEYAPEPRPHLTPQ